MEILLQEDSKDTPKGYEMTVTTYTGDGDCYHSFKYHFGMDVEGLKAFIIAFHVVECSYANGRGGCDNYTGAHWDLINDEWNHDTGGNPDTPDSYSLVFHNGDGFIIPCKVTLDAADMDEISASTAEDR